MSLKGLLREAAPAVCQAALPLGAWPVLQAAPGARLLIVGQAPGRKVHATGRRAVNVRRSGMPDCSGTSARSAARCWWGSTPRSTICDRHERTR